MWCVLPCAHLRASPQVPSCTGDKCTAGLAGHTLSEERGVGKSQSRLSACGQYHCQPPTQQALLSWSSTPSQQTSTPRQSCRAAMPSHVTEAKTPRIEANEHDAVSKAHAVAAVLCGSASMRPSADPPACDLPKNLLFQARQSAGRSGKGVVVCHHDLPGPPHI